MTACHATAWASDGQRSLLFMLEELRKTVGDDVLGTPVELKYLASTGPAKP